MNGTIEFLDHKNIGLDTKTIMLSGLFKSYDQNCIYANYLPM